MSKDRPTKIVRVVWLGCLLIGAAGAVDAIGYLTLGEIYVANMSGNTVSVAIHLAKLDWSDAWAHACPLVAFMPGLIAGDAIVELCKRRNFRAALAPALLTEAVGLILFLILADHSISSRGVFQSPGGVIYALLVGLLAFSMGLQNGALRRIGALKNVHTYVTGTLLAAAHWTTEYFFWLGRRLRRSPGTRLGRVIAYSRRQRALRSACLAGLLWTLYILGAVLGAVALARLGINILLVPIVVLLLISVLDAIKPLRRPAEPAPTPEP